MPDDESNIADELAIEVPFNIVEKLGDSLEIGTDQGTLLLSKETIQQLQRDGIDLCFHIVPIREQEEQEDVVDRTTESEQVKEAVAQVDGKQINILGTPREIETNYKGYETEIILPLDDVLYDGINLDMLRVYIEHTDGEKVVEYGEIVYDENGNPIGIKFTVNKFSTFTIFEILTEVEAETPTQPEEDSDETETPVEEPQKETEEETSNNSGEEVVNNDEQEDTNTDETEEIVQELDKQTAQPTAETNNKLPKTAGTSYNFLLAGSLFVLAGLFLLVMKRRRDKKA